MKSFTIFQEYYDLITLLSENEQKDVLMAVVRYMFDNEEPKLNKRQQKIFNNLRIPLDISKKRSKSGSVLKSNKNQNEIKLISKQYQNDNTEEGLCLYNNINTINSNNINNINNNNKEDFFEIFWQHYPKKRDKGRTEKWFIKNKITKEFLDKMLIKIEELKKTKQWQKENGQFIPYPSTWLNSKGWEDEVDKNEKNNNVPIWLNKENKSTEATPEEIAELDKLFEEVRQ